MTIIDFYFRHFEPICLLGKSPATIEVYREAIWTASHYAEGREMHQWTLNNACRHIADYSKTHAAATFNKLLRHLKVICRAAQKQGVAQLPWLDEIPKLPEHRDDPEGYLLEEVELLVVTASKMPGEINGVPAGLWWPGLLLVIYVTGERITAVMLLRSLDFDASRRNLYFRAGTRKNGKPRRYNLTDQAAARLAAIWCPHRELLFDWPYDRSTRQWKCLTKQMRRIIDQAGLPQPRKPFHKLRTTSGSMVEAAGGSGATHLGHSSPTIFRDYYRDSRIVADGQSHFLPTLNLGDMSPAPLGAWVLD